MEKSDAFGPLSADMIRRHEQFFVFLSNLPELDILQKLDQLAMKEFHLKFKKQCILYGWVCSLVFLVALIAYRRESLLIVLSAVLFVLLLYVFGFVGFYFTGKKINIDNLRNSFYAWSFRNKTMSNVSH